MSDSGTLWTAACQTALSMGFSRQEYWSGLPLSSPGDLPNPGVESGSPALQADSLPTEPQGLVGSNPVCVGVRLRDARIGLHPWASLVAQTVKRPPTTRETWVRSLGREDPLEKETVREREKA